MSSARIYFFLLLFGVWLWASSIFTPWAESTDARLWLYDLLFYARYVLMLWGIIEFLLACQQLRSKTEKRKYSLATIGALVFAASSGFAYTYLMQTSTGLSLRVQMSSQALAELSTPTFANRRQRAAWFLIDNQRRPCVDQAWLWLGQVYGGGSGNNTALVYSDNAAPKSPVDDAFKFRRVTGHWWLAYQNPGKYYAHLKVAQACTVGEQVDTHDAGLQFIKSK